jgi:hypothetical protein
LKARRWRAFKKPIVVFPAPEAQVKPPTGSKREMLLKVLQSNTFNKSLV